MSAKLDAERTIRARAMALPEPQMRILLAYLVGVNRAAVESGLEFLAAIDLGDPGPEPPAVQPPAAAPFMCACGTHIPRPTELTDEGCPTCYTVWELSGATPTIKAPSGVMYRDSAGEIRSITAEQPTVVVEVDTGIQVAEVAGPMPALDAITWLNQHAHEYRSALQLVPVEVDGSPREAPGDVVYAEIHEADCGGTPCTCGAGAQVSYLACGDQLADSMTMETGTPFQCQRHGPTYAISVQEWLARTPAEPVAR